MISAASPIVGTFSSVNFSAGEEVTYTIPFYLDGTLSTNATPFAINYNILRTKNIGLFPTVEYWDTVNEQWTSSAPNNKEVVTTANQFSDFSVTTKEEFSAPSSRVTIILYLPYRHTGSSLTYLYFDDITIERKRSFGKDKVSVREVTQNSNKIENEFTPHATSYFLCRARNIPSSSIVPSAQTLTQQKMNDYRSHVSRYEGTFYNNNKTPVSPKNKIWVNFAKKFVTTNQGGTNTDKIYVNFSTIDLFNDKEGWYVTNGSITTPIQITDVVLGIPLSYYEIDANITYSSGDVFAFSEFNAVKLPVSNEYPTHEPVSCMIDSMEYNVKANTVSVVMHVPNQDDDVSSTFKEVTRK
jgi:hypothetical protein